MLTLSAYTSPIRRVPQRTPTQRYPKGIGRWTRCQTEILKHLTVLEQATMAVLEGYLSGPLYHRAAHAVQQLPALTETMSWREGTQVAHAMARLFCPTATFGLVQALQLSELLAAFYRERARASARQPRTRGRDAVGAGGPVSFLAPAGADGASATEALGAGMGERAAGTERSAACSSV